MIAQDLLDLLVCPECIKPVRLTTDNAGLKCPQCHRIFPIEDDIPIMLLDSAKVDPSKD